MDASRHRDALVLPGLPSSRSGVMWTLCAVAAVLLSRLLLLPDGPWEQDEALFAAGVLDFDVTRHRPHPPGFPGWIAIGKLLLPLLGDPIRALQVASSVSSAVLFWAMAVLLARIVPGGRASLLALAFTCTPLAWVHAGRAFSTTPALALACVALILWARGPAAHRLGWGALAIAALVRPQLCPELAVVAIAGLTEANVPRPVRVGGVAIAMVMCGLGATIVLLDAPGAAQAFMDHFARHRADVGGALDAAELGFVRGLVHPLLAAVVAACAALGVALALRADRRRGAWLLGVLGVTGWMILRQHEPTFPRYAVALLAATMPAIAWLTNAAPRGLAYMAIVLSAIVGTAASLGILLWMHAAPLPIVAAARLATAAPDASGLAYSHGAFSFARLEAERAGVRALDVDDPQTLPPLPPRTYVLEGRTLHTLEGLTTCTIEFDQVPPQASLLGQGRFTSARLARDAVVLGPGTYAPERDDEGDRFAWMSPEATLFLPTEASNLQLRIEVPYDVAGGRLLVADRAFDLVVGPMALSVPVERHDIRLRLDREHVASDDPRVLGIRLEAAWVEGNRYRPAHGRWSPGRPRSLRAHDVTLEGFEAPESFAHARRGAWTHAEAMASFPAVPGTLVLRMARPEHVAGRVIVETRAQRRELEVGPTLSTVALRTEASGGRAVLRLSSPTFVPAQVREGSRDDRELGLILYEVEFVPDQDPCVPLDATTPRWD